MIKRTAIKKKKCKCGCDKFPTIGFAGYNYFCAPEEIKSKKMSSIKTIKIKKTKTKDAQLEKFFEKAKKEIERFPVCQECGSWISRTYYRAATAHIFPKSTFPSVATHPKNYLVLGAHCGCHDKTHTIESFSKMKVWEKAWKQFAEFKDEIKEKHKYYDLFVSKIPFPDQLDFI